MTNSTETYWAVDGVSLQTLAFNIATLGGDRLSVPPLRGDNLRVPHAVGEQWLPKIEDSRIITLTMWVIGADESTGFPPSDESSRRTFETNLRKLQRLLWTPRRELTVTKRFWYPEAELISAGLDTSGLEQQGDYVLITATAKAQYASGLAPSMTGPTRANFTVDLQLADPFFYGDELEIDFTADAPALVATRYSQPANPSPQNGSVLDTGYGVSDPESAFTGSTAVRTALAGVDPTQYGEVVTFGERTGTEAGSLSAGASYGRSTVSTDIPVTAGTRYVFSLYSKILNLSSQTVGLRISFYNAANALISYAETGYASLVQGAFTRLVSPGILVPTGATHATIATRTSASGTPWRGQRKNRIPLATYPTIPSSGLPFTLSAGTGGAIADLSIAATETWVTNPSPAPGSGSHIAKYQTRPNATTVASAITPTGTSGAVVLPVTQYVASCYVASSRLQSSGARIDIVWYDSTGALISTSSSAYTLPTTLSTQIANGATWISRTSASVRIWNSVTYGNGLWVAVVGGSGAAAGGVMTSPDGTTWTSRTSAVAPSTVNFQSVVYGNGLFVAVGLGGTAAQEVQTSPDGITWTSRTAAAASQWTSVTYGNGLFVAVATGALAAASVMTSPDGITWTIRTAALGSQWQSVTYGNGLYVAVANIGTAAQSVMTSPDGITWTIRTAAVAGATSLWNSVTYGNGLFVAVGEGGTAAQAVMTSPDGITWTSRTAAVAGTTALWKEVAYGNGLFVAVGWGGTAAQCLMTSPDGITWTSRTAISTGWQCVAYGNGLFVSISFAGTTTTNLMTTTTTFSLSWQRLNLSATAPETAAYAAVQIEIADANIYQAANSDFWAVGAPMLTKGSDLLDWFWGNSAATSDGLIHSWDATNKISLRTGDSVVIDRIAVTEGTVVEDYYDGATVYTDPDKDYDWVSGAYASRSVLKLPDSTDAGAEQEFIVIGDARTSRIEAQFFGPLWAPEFENDDGPVSVRYSGKILTGDSAVVDVEQYTATKTVSAVESDVSGAISHEGAAQWLYLDPGSVTVRLKVDAGTGTAKLIYQPRWF